MHVPKRFSAATSITTIALGVVVFLFFQLKLEGHIFLRESASLILFSGEFVSSYLSKAAPLLAFVDDFLCQFFYLRFLGATIVAVLAMCEFLAWRWALRGSLWALAVAVVDIAFLATNDHSLGMPIGSIAAACLVRLFTIFGKCKSQFLQAFLMISAAAVVTFAIGIHALIGSLCAAAVFIFRRESGKALSACVASLAALAVSLTLSRSMMLTFSQFALSQTAATAFASVVFASLFVSILAQFSVPKFVPVLVSLLCGVGLAFAVPDFHEDRILLIDAEYFFGNHSRVNSLLAEDPNSNYRLACYYQNLESARRGTLSDDLFSHPQASADGLFIVPNPQTSWLTQMSGFEAFALAGCATSAQHCAMLSGTFSPKKRSVRSLEYLRDVNTQCGDSLAAAKYARLLSKSLFHSDLITRNRHSFFRPENDTIFPVADVAVQLRLSYEKTGNAAALDYLLCYDLLTKNIAAFDQDFHKYRPKKIGRHYIEAQLVALKMKGEKPSKGEFSDDDVVRFLDYTKLYAEKRHETLRAKYSDTFWYFYHFSN